LAADSRPEGSGAVAMVIKRYRVKLAPDAFEAAPKNNVIDMLKISRPDPMNFSSSAIHIFNRPSPIIRN
jgi:hypothetical protein